MSALKSRLRAEFDELVRKRDEIRAISTPMRETRDKFKNEMQARLRQMDDEIRKIEEPLYELETDIGSLARAVGGRYMSDGRGNK